MFAYVFLDIHITTAFSFERISSRVWALFEESSVMNDGIAILF